MPYKIEIEYELAFIRLIYSGEVTLEQRINVLNELFIEYNVFGKFRFLIDVRAVNNILTPIEQELFGKYIASRSEFKNAKIAVINLPEQKINNALLAYAGHSGLQTQIFQDESAAIVWLTE